MGFELVEPLRNLFKDEVRTVGEELGLPRGDRPAPAVPRARASRCASSATSRAERLEIVRKADHIVRDELHRAGLEREIWQSYAALIGVQSVGVQGDERTYAYPIVVRAVTSEDAMTADWARIPLRGPRPDQQPDHRRGPRREPRGLRHHVEAPRHDRVGVTTAST